jgi:FlaA1/EpsC-like NDP-sugar epimerase
VTDAGVVVSSIAIAQLVRFGTDPATFHSEVVVYSYTAASAVLILAWFSVLVLFRSREPRALVSTGVEEFRRVAHASIALFASVAIISFLLKLDVARGYLAVALPLGLASLLLTRWLWRRWLAKERSEGHFISTVLVVGSHNADAAMAQEFERVQATGYRVAEVAVPGWGTDRGDSVNVDGHPAATGYRGARGGATASHLSSCKTESQRYHAGMSTARTTAVLNSRFYETVPAISLC